MIKLDNSEWLELGNDFSIKENTVYLGPNGSGKTTLYNKTKEKYVDFRYFSYDDCKEKVLKEKTKIIISIRAKDIEKAENDKKEIIDEINLKKMGFDKFEISSAKSASQYSDFCKEIYSNNESGILNFDGTSLEELCNYEDEEKKKFILKYSNDLNNLNNLDEVRDKIKSKYIYEALNYLENSVGDEEKICPVCGCEHDRGIKEIYEEKKKEYEKELDKVIDEYRKYTNKNVDEIKRDIQDMCSFVRDNNINSKVSARYIMIGGDSNNIEKIEKAQKKLKKLNNEIENIKLEQEQFYNNLLRNKEKIKKILNKAFCEEVNSIDFKKEEKIVEIKLKRDAKTFSTGEIDYIVFLLNMLEFEYSDKDTIIIDDPLSSYDIKKQYEIAFDIINRLVKNSKKVIIFTHSIDLINILNSQYLGKFQYCYIEKRNKKLCNYPINLRKKDSILNIDNLYDATKGNNLSKWLKLLIEKEEWKKDDEKNKLFHYDEECRITIDDIEYCNNDLVELIDNIDNIDIDPNLSFEELALRKIVTITATRVWIEKKMKENFNGEIEGDTLMEKIDYYFRNNDLWIEKYKIEKEDLTRKKVMINQNSHYKSQILPFQYALSVSVEDILTDVSELRELFKSKEK